MTTPTTNAINEAIEALDLATGIRLYNGQYMYEVFPEITAALSKLKALKAAVPKHLQYVLDEDDGVCQETIRKSAQLLSDAVGGG